MTLFPCFILISYLTFPFVFALPTEMEDFFSSSVLINSAGHFSTGCNDFEAAHPKLNAKKTPTSFHNLHLTRTNIALSASHLPGCFTFHPPLFGIGSIRLAFAVRRKPEDSLAQGERARPCTVRIFN